MSAALSNWPWSTGRWSCVAASGRLSVKASAAPTGHCLLSGPAADHGVAFSRGTDVVTVVTRWPLALEEEGGWRSTSLSLPPGQWADVLSGRHHRGDVLVRELLVAVPVALLEKIREPRGRRG
jgi:maltooligosyltrehalose synthase